MGERGTGAESMESSVWWTGDCGKVDGYLGTRG